MNKKEIIVLDARLLNVLGDSAFQAVLSNGHRVVAYVRKNDRQRADSLETGQDVQIRMSPYNMSKGQIIFEEQAGTDNESQKFS
jgi:translation initiation factor IF-1